MTQSFEHKNERVQYSAHDVLEKFDTFFENISAEYEFLIIGKTITYRGVTLYFSIEENQDAITAYRQVYAESENTDEEIHNYLVSIAVEHLQKSGMYLDSAYSNAGNLLRYEMIDNLGKNDETDEPQEAPDAVFNRFVVTSDALGNAFKEMYDNPILRIKKYPLAVAESDINTLRITQGDTLVFSEITAETLLQEHQARSMNIDVFDETGDYMKHSYVITSYKTNDGVELALVSYVPTDKPNLKAVLQDIQEVSDQIDEVNIKIDLENLKSLVSLYLATTMTIKNSGNSKEEDTLEMTATRFNAINNIENKITEFLDKYKETYLYSHLIRAVANAKAKMDTYMSENDFLHMVGAVERDANPDELNELTRILTKV